MLARNSLFSIAGSVVPVLITVATLPVLLAAVGAERYGALALCWLILVYSAHVLGGVGTAITHAVARAGANDGVARETMATGLATAMVVSPITAAVAGFIAYVFFAQFFQVSEAVKTELLQSIWLIGASSFISGIARACIGALIGKERFAVTSVSSMVSNGGLPLLALVFAHVFGPTMSSLLWASFTAYSLGLVILLIDLWRSQLRGNQAKLSWSRSKGLLQFGFWIMAAAIIAPLLLTLDRMVIGAQLGAIAVAAYTIPFQIISRLQLVPQSLVNVLFPRFSASEGEKARKMAFFYSVVMTGLFAPMIVGLIYIIEPLLHLWLRDQLDPQSFQVGVWLLLSFYVTAIGNTVTIFMQSQGRGDLAAKIQMAEIVPYAILLLYCTVSFGLMGVVMAFLLRRIFEAVVFVACSGIGSAAFWKTQIPAGLGLAVAIATVGLVDGSILKFLGGSMLASFVLIGACILLPAELRAMILEHIRKRIPLKNHGTLD